MELIKGRQLWLVIEQAARDLNGVGQEYTLTMIDIDTTPYLGQSKYRLRSGTKLIEGVVDYNPYKEE